MVRYAGSRDVGAGGRSDFRPRDGPRRDSGDGQGSRDKPRSSFGGDRGPRRDSGRSESRDRPRSSFGDRGGSRDSGRSSFGGDRGPRRDSGRSSFGGDRGGRPDFRGGSRDRGPRRELVMHKTTCDECGKNCEVPFNPTEGKPIYCDTCFKTKGNNHNNPGQDFSKDFAQINEKLDKLIKFLNVE